MNPCALPPSVRILPHMGSELEERYREALSRINASALARWGSRALRTIQAYAGGERRVTDDAARELVSYLRHRSSELADAADAVEAALEKGEDHADH